MHIYYVIKIICVCVYVCGGGVRMGVVGQILTYLKVELHNKVGSSTLCKSGSVSIRITSLKSLSFC